MFQMLDKKNDVIYCSMLFFVAYIILAIIIRIPIYTYDTFWHLQMGKDLLEHGLSPWVDHYSVRYQGHDIYPVPLMFQMTLYRFVSFFGEQAGFYYIRLFYITLMMMALWVYFRKIKANSYITFILLPLVVSAVAMRILIRPELLSNVMVVVCLILYLNAQRSFAIKQILAICILLLFWTSYHSPIIGYIIIFGLFLEKAINKVIHQDDSFSWRQWLLWGALIFTIGFINLNFYGQSIVGPHFIASIISAISGGFAQYTQEYVNAYSVNATNVLTNVSWMLSLYVVIWSLVKRQYGFTFIVILLTFMSLSMVRLLSVVLILNMCVLALYLVQFFNAVDSYKLRQSVKNILIVAPVIISLMAFYFLIERAHASIKLDQNRLAESEARYPVQVADYLKNFQSGGNILNLIQHGSYFIYKLSPDYKVYIDGRTNILYPGDFFKHNIDLWQKTETVENVVGRYDINYVLRKNTPARFVLLKRVKNIELSFADDNFLLFSRAGKAEFPLASTLLAFPRCWQNSYYQAKFSRGIQSEIERSERMFTGKRYTLKSTLEFLKDYLATDDKKTFFNASYFDKNYSDSVRKIALYMAIKDADKDTVSDLFGMIGLKSDYDILLYSYYLAKNGEYEDAENLAYYFYVLVDAGKVRETHDKFGILGRIFKILKEHNHLQKFKSSYVDELEANLKKVNYPFDKELSFNFMCQ